jgi:single-strand DNA-binding protein
MRGFNKVILMGNLARDPDIRSTATKQRVATFTLAVGRQWKDKASGEKKSAVDWIQCVAWGSLADICELYTKKGRPLLIEGRLSIRSYDDQKAGVKKWISEVIVENLTLLPSGRREDDSNESAPARRQPAQPNKAAASNNGGGFDDDFPLDMSDYDEGYNNAEDVPF